jgi:hypothetical protein
MSHFYEDLVRIRKSKRLSKQDVFFKCRIPMETIESIEDGSILSGGVRNKTYMRSYFRTYGKALGISGEDITTALDEHDTGLYRQGLLMKYLPEEMKTDSAAQPGDLSGGEDSPEAGSAKKDADQKDDAGVSKVKKEPGQPDDTLPRPQKSKIITPENQEKSVDDIEWEDDNIKKVRSTSTITYSSSKKDSTPADPAPVDSRQAKPASQPDVEGIDWASKVKQAVYRPQKNRLLWVILAILLALALAMASIVWYWQADDSELGDPAATERLAPADGVPPAGADPASPQPGTGTPEAADPVPPDVTGAGEPETVEETTPPPMPPTRQEIVAQLEAFSTTGDTLYIHAYAVHGNLEPIRVVSDIFAGDDIQVTPARPYWVEQRHAMRFDFVDEIILRGSLSRMVLLFNGHIIEDFSKFYTDGSEVRISRDLLMENDKFDIAAGDPFSDLEPPRFIVDRPRFSP